jgi:SAM-dependent methyltransferase
VTGFDCLHTCVTKAKRTAAAAESKARFLCLDLVSGDLAAHGPFDFLFDVRCLEWITDENNRARFLQNVRRALAPGGRYLSINEGRPDPPPGAVDIPETKGTELPTTAEPERADALRLHARSQIYEVSTPIAEPAMTTAGAAVPTAAPVGGIGTKERTRKRIQTPAGLRAELRAAGFPSCRVDYVYSASVPPLRHCLWALATA